MREARSATAEQIDFGLDVWCSADDELDLLRRELAALGDTEPQVSALLLYELGRTMLAMGGEVEGTQHLLRAYTLRPQFRPTISLARLIYRRRGDLKLVAKLLDAEARATRDPLTRCALLRQQAHLLWLRQNDIPGALERLEEALRLDAGNLATLKLLDLLYLLSGDAAGRRPVLARQIDVVADSDLRTAILADLALLGHASAPAKAVETLQRAHAEQPQNHSVLLLLEALQQEGEDHQGLCETLLRQARLPKVSRGFRARLYARAGRLHRGVLADPGTAVELLLRSLSMQPELGVAADAFELLLAQNQHRAAVELGAQLFELDDTPSFRAALACQLGDLCRHEVDSTEKAILWYRRCLAAMPSYQPALEGLSTLLDRAGDVDAQLAVHRADLATATRPRGRAQRLYRIACVLEKAGRAEEARAAHLEALAAQPGFLPAVAALERLFTESSRWTELLQLYDEQIARETDAERVVHLLETMAAIWYHQLGHLDNAIEAYQRILERAPDNVTVLRSTARLCAEARRWDELQALNEREVALIADPQRRAEVLQRAGEVWEERLLDFDHAIDCYRRALDYAPRYLPALRALGRLYRQKARWSELIEMHRMEVAASSDPEQIVTLLAAIAEVYEDELLQPDDAAATHREILTRRPNHLSSINALARIYEDRRRWPELVALLESSIDAVSDERGKALQLWKIALLQEERLGDREAALRDHARALRLAPDLAPAQAALARIYEETGQFQQLFDLHAARHERSEEGSNERALLAGNLADLLERHGATGADHRRQAALMYERSTQVDAPPRWSLWSLQRLYGRLGLPAEQARALERLAAATTDPRFAAELHLRIARVKRRAGLGDPLPHLQRAREHGVARAFTARATEEQLRRKGDDDLEALLLARIEGTRDPLEQACLWAELADEQLRRGESAAAERGYRRALEQMRGHPMALAGLAKIFETEERWKERAELAEQEAASMESTKALAATLYGAGLLWHERVGDAARATPLYERALQVQPGHPEAYAQLRRIHQERGAWMQLASLIRAQITATKQDPVVAEMFRELGRIYIAHLGQPRKAEACLRRVVDLAPFDTYALLTLGELYIEREKWDRAEEVLAAAEPVLIDASQRRALRLRLAEVYQALADTPRALEVLQRALDDSERPDASLLRLVAAAAAAAQDPATEATVLERLADLTRDPPEQIALRKAVARLANDRLDETDRAIRALQEVLALDPLDLEATESLAGIYGRLGHRSAVNQHLQASVSHHRAELANRPFEASLYRQLGRIFRWQRLFDRLYCSYIALSQLDSLGETEHAFLLDHHQRCSVDAAAPLLPKRYERLVLPPEVSGPLRPFLRAAQPIMRRLVGQKPSDYGLSRGSKAGPKTTAWASVAAVAEILGFEGYELWLGASDPELITGAYFTAPALVLGSAVTARIQALAPSDRFRLGHALFLLSEGSLLLEERSVRELRALFGAFGLAAQPVVELPLSTEDREAAAQESTRLLRALGRKERRLLGELLQPLVGDFAAVDVGAYARGLAHGAQRAGLLLAGNALAGLQQAAQLGDSAGRGLADLLQYLVSEEYLTLRIELGLAPGSA